MVPTATVDENWNQRGPRTPLLGHRSWMKEGRVEGDRCPKRPTAVCDDVTPFYSFVAPAALHSIKALWEGLIAFAPVERRCAAE